MWESYESEKNPKKKEKVSILSAGVLVFPADCPWDLASTAIVDEQIEKPKYEPNPAFEAAFAKVVEEGKEREAVKKAAEAAAKEDSGSRIKPFKRRD